MKLFLFPLGQNLLHPGTSKPINVFESRYLRMIRDSLQERVPIAVAFTESSEGRIEKGKAVPFVREVVGFGFPEILEQRMDGTMMILISCEGKARLGPVLEDRRPYIVASAEVLSERHDLDGSRAISYLNLQRFLVRWIGHHVRDPQVRHQFVKSLHGPIEVVGAAVNYLVQDPDLQQAVLESDDINIKIDWVSRIILSTQTN